MDEVNAHLNTPQYSTCSDTNTDETYKLENNSSPRFPERKICLLGALSKDSSICSVAAGFGVPVVSSFDGKEYIEENRDTIFVMESFDGGVFNYLSKTKQSILGPLALRQLANQKDELPRNTRPLFNLAMSGVVVCVTGFRNKAELAALVPLIHHMGGSIRKEVSNKITHLIANHCWGEKYRYAATFRLPILQAQWVHAAWEQRYDMNFQATQDVFIGKYRLNPFHGAHVCFYGFAEEEEKHMTEILLANGGTVATLDDSNCSHVVMEHSDVYTLEPASAPLSPKPTRSSSPDEFPKQNSTSDPINYSYFLETLHEKSRDEPHDEIDQLINDADNTCLDQTIDRSNCNSPMMSRKRKINHLEQSHKVKRKRDKSMSEKKRRISGIFKTPVNYFSQRRRTIDASTFHQNLNDSVLSSSGIFTIETVTNLSCVSDCGTPQGGGGGKKHGKKNLFSRTFGSSKSKSKKKIDLNVTNYEECDSGTLDKLNNSCFPNFSLSSNLPTQRSDCHKDFRGSSVAVVDEASVTEKPDTVVTKPFIVKAEWFWTSVQKEISLDEKDYSYNDYFEQVVSPTRRESHQATPSSASRRKRKRLHETLLSLATHSQSPSLHKRRSSVSDAGLLSVSGSFLDCTTSPDKALSECAVEPAVDTPRKALTLRQQVFMELVQTETNYVAILHTIMVMFKKHLEEMPEEEALLNNTELNLIFGKLPAIYETHVKMLNDLQMLAVRWSEEHSIGNIIVGFSTELLKAYPPYINYFEEMKEMMTQCDQNKPRFHAFLKACQTKPECGRQSLQELMIRPVQRLGSISLLLNDILKNTPKTNPDHAALVQALAALREVMTHINEDKRKTEGQVILFNIFNDIDNCPPDIVSSHRNFIAKTEVIQLSSSEGLGSRGNNLVLFLFSDQLEVCKKKSKAFNSLKSPSSVSSLQRSLTKVYKHIRLISLNSIKRVIDIKETDECQKVFSLVCRNSDEVKERLYTFTMADEDADKAAFLKILTRQMANNACTADADKFLAYLEPHQLDIETSDVSNGTLSKAFKFASRTKLKVGRAFSFNKTPSKLKRAVSSMMSPFGSSTNITPASQLAQMRLASYNNINELGSAEHSTEAPPVAPMSVQPTRKMKAASMNVNALKRI